MSRQENAHTEIPIREHCLGKPLPWFTNSLCVTPYETSGSFLSHRSLDLRSALRSIIRMRRVAAIRAREGLPCF